MWRRALRLAGEVRRLRRANQELLRELVVARREVVVMRESVAQMRRDSDLVALMARDPRVALGFLSTQREIAALDETEM